MNKIIVENDTMRFYSTPVPIPVGGSQWSKIFFMFSDEWEDLRKIAQFRQGELKRNVDIDSNNFCYVPNEMFPDMCGELSIVGYPQDTASTTIATANSLMLNFVQGFESGGEPAVPPTPDLYQKLIKEFAESGGGRPDAVLYSKQELTEEQQKQARDNIGALDVNIETTPVDTDVTLFGRGENIVYVKDGWLKPCPTDADNELILQYRRVFEFIGSQYPEPSSEDILLEAKSAYALYQKGLASERIKVTNNPLRAAQVYVTWNLTTRSNKHYFYYAQVSTAYQYGCTYCVEDDALTSELYQSPVYRTAYGVGEQDSVSQFRMSVAPTEDMHVATKQYVDIAKTEAQQLGLTTATPGKTIKVKTVQDGKPTEWEAVDMPGEGVEWYEVIDMETAENVNDLIISTDKNGRPISGYHALEMVLCFMIPADSTQTSTNGTIWVYPMSDDYLSSGLRIITNVASWKTIPRTFNYFYAGSNRAIFVPGATSALTFDGSYNNVFDGIRLYIHAAGDHLPTGTKVRCLVLSKGWTA